MPDEPIQIELCAPERRPVKLAVSEAILPGKTGVFTVLPGHTPCLTELTPGVVLTYDANEEVDHYAVTDGFAEVRDDRVIILATAFEHRAEIDPERAEAARKRAEERLTAAHPEVDTARATAALHRALARIRAHSAEVI